MELKDKFIKFLLTEFGFSQKDLDKVKALLDNINIKAAGDTTVIEIRLNKISVLLENDKNVY